MWLCPVCKKDNIENASSCLYCGSGRYCSDCLLPYVGDVCTTCGKSHLNGLWLTEKEYEAYLASRDDGKISKKTENADSVDVTMAVGFSKAEDFDGDDASDSISDDTDITDNITDTQHSSKENGEFFVSAADFGDDAEKGDSDETDGDNEACDINAQDVSQDVKCEDDAVEDEAIEQVAVEQVAAEQIAVEDSLICDDKVSDDTGSQDMIDDVSDEDLSVSLPMAEDDEQDVSVSCDNDDISQMSDEETEKALKDEEQNYNALWIFLISTICVVVIFAYTLLTIKPWEEESSKKSSAPKKQKPEIEVFTDSADESDIGESSSLSDADVFVDSSLLSYAESNSDANFAYGSDLNSIDESSVSDEAETYSSQSVPGSEISNKAAHSAAGEKNVNLATADKIGTDSKSSPDNPNNNHMKTTANPDTMPALNVANSNFKSSLETSGHISAGYNHIIAIDANGKIVATGNNDHKKLDVSKLSGVKTVSARGNHSVALMNNGTAKASGSNTYGRCDVSGWSSLVDVKAGSYHTIGLKSDGTVVSTGKNDNNQCNVSGWKNIIGISAGAEHSVALKSDGTVVAAGDNTYGQCNVSGWKDIVQISAGDRYTIGLKADGSVVACGDNARGQCNVSSWNSIVFISSGMTHTLGLRADGSVVAAGYNKYGECEVSSWKNVACVSAGGEHFSVALFKDGTVKVIGNNVNNIFDASKWTQIAM